MNLTPTPHIACGKEDIAKTVLMPGDPKRSRFIAGTFLENARLVNDIRGVQGYTGFYKGKEVSVMSSGIGIPSIGIYAYELFNFYDIDRIIRIGTAGSIVPYLDMGDLLLAEIAYTNDNFLDQFPFPEDYIPTAAPALLDRAKKIADEKKIPYTVGKILTENLYYTYEETIIEDWAKKGVLAFEMETACLYALAKAAGKEALAVISISNNILFKTEMDPSKRETGLTNMIEVALELA